MSKARDTADWGQYKPQRKNLIINGNFNVWQRGSSVNGITNGVYAADRWQYWFGDEILNVLKQGFSVGQTNVPNEPEFYAKHQLSGASASGQWWMVQKIEDVRTLAGEEATVSFYARSTVGTTLSGASMRQDFGSGGSTAVTTTGVVDDGTLTANVWKKITVSVSVPSISGKIIGTNHSLWLIIQLPDNLNADVDIAQVQVEKGIEATDFEFRSYAEEYHLCKRYYQKSFGINLTPADSQANNYHIATAYATSADRVFIPLPVEMRVAPTVTLYQPAAGGTSGRWAYYNGSAWVDYTNTVVATASAKYILIQSTGSFSLYDSHHTNGLWVADAEL